MKKGILYTPYERDDVRERIQRVGFELIREDVGGNCYDVLARKPSA